MSKYNKEYFVGLPYNTDDRIIAARDEKQGNPSSLSGKVALNGPAYVFHNMRKDRHKKAGRSWPVTDVIPVLFDFLVNGEIAAELKKYAISGMQTLPSVYEDDDGVIHDDYWFLHFYQGLDCWCRDRSTIMPIDIDEDDDGEILKDMEELGIEFPKVVVKYFLDENVLDPIPLEERLIFSMRGASVEFTFFHKKLVDFIQSKKTTGIRFVSVSDFEQGRHI